MLARLSIRFLYPLLMAKNLTEKGCLEYNTKLQLIIILYFIKSGDWIVEYLFIAIKPKSNLISSVSNCQGHIIGLNDTSYK